MTTSPCTCSAVSTYAGGVGTELLREEDEDVARLDVAEQQLDVLGVEVGGDIDPRASTTLACKCAVHVSDGARARCKGERLRLQLKTKLKCTRHMPHATCGEVGVCIAC